MMDVRKPMIFAVLLVTFGLLLAGCGRSRVSADDSTAVPTVPPTAAAVSAAAGDATKGEQTFQTTCIACHGADAKGVQGLGKSLHASDSEFVRSQSDDQLVEFIKTGRQPGDPLNTTGVAMPPKGGNPALTDADLYNIVAWLRTLE